MKTNESEENPKNTYIHQLCEQIEWRVVDNFTFPRFNCRPLVFSRYGETFNFHYYLPKFVQSFKDLSEK